MLSQSNHLEKSEPTAKQALAQLIKETGKGCALSKDEITVKLIKAIDAPNANVDSLLATAVNSQNIIAAKFLTEQFIIDKKDIVSILFNENIFAFTAEEKTNIQRKKDFVTPQHTLVEILLDQLNQKDQQGLLERTITEGNYFIFHCLIIHLKKLNRLKPKDEDQLYVELFQQAIEKTMPAAACYAAHHSDIKKNAKSLNNHVGVDNKIKSVFGGYISSLYRYYRPTYDTNAGKIIFQRNYCNFDANYSGETDYRACSRDTSYPELILYYLQEQALWENPIRIAEVLVSLGWHEHTIRAIAAAYHNKHITLPVAKRLINAWPNKFNTADVFYIVSMGITEIINNHDLVSDELIKTSYLDQSLLVVAIDNNDSNMIHALLVRGAPINATIGMFLGKKELSLALLAAIRRGNLSNIKLLLQYGAILLSNADTLKLIDSTNKIAQTFLLAYLNIKSPMKNNKYFEMLSDENKLGLYRIFENSSAVQTVFQMLPAHLQQLVTRKETLLEEQSTSDTLETSATTEETSAAVSSTTVSSSSYKSKSERRQLLLDAILETAPGCGLSETDVIDKLNAAYVEFSDINSALEENNLPFITALKAQNLIAIKWLMQKKYLGENLEAFENYLALIHSLGKYKNAEFAFKVAVMLLEGPIKETFSSKPVELDALYFQLFEACVRNHHIEKAINVAEMIDKLNFPHHMMVCAWQSDKFHILDKVKEIQHVISILKAKKITSQEATQLINGILKFFFDGRKIQLWKTRYFCSQFNISELKFCAANGQNDFLSIILEVGLSGSRKINDFLTTAACNGNIQLIKDAMQHREYKNHLSTILSLLPTDSDQENMKERLLCYQNAIDAAYSYALTMKLFKLLDDRDKTDFINFMKRRGFKDITKFESLLPKKENPTPSAPELSAACGSPSAAIQSNEGISNSSMVEPSAPSVPSELLSAPCSSSSAAIQSSEGIHNSRIVEPSAPLEPAASSSASFIPAEPVLSVSDEQDPGEEGKPNLLDELESHSSAEGEVDLTPSFEGDEDEVATVMSVIYSAEQPDELCIGPSSHPPAPVRNNKDEFDINQWTLFPSAPQINAQSQEECKKENSSSYFEAMDEFDVMNDPSPRAYSPKLFQAPQVQQADVASKIAFFESLIELSNDERFIHPIEGIEMAVKLMTFAANELAKTKKADSGLRM